MVAISLEHYLSLHIPVASTPKESDDRLSDDIAEEVIEFRIWPWLECSVATSSYYIDRFRTRRYDTLDTDDDVLSASSAVDAKYVQPVLRIASKFFEWSWNAPPLKVSSERSPRGAWKTRIFTSGDAELWAMTLNTRVDWSEFKKCLCVVIFVDNDTIRVDDFPLRQTSTFRSSTSAGRLMMDLLDTCRETEATFGIITDERTSLVYGHQIHFPQVDIVSHTQIPLRKLLVIFILHIARSCGLCRFGNFEMPYLGALNDGNAALESLDIVKRERRSFHDFDVYTMQRVPGEWRRFYSWKLWVEKIALRTTIEEGSTLSINVNGFMRRELLYRSPFPSIPLAEGTLEIAIRHPRPRDIALDTLLATNADLTFQVTKVIRSGPNHWSQVFFGHFVNASERVLCLKVFDERFFHMPLEPDWEDTFTEPVNRRLETFNPAVELVQREEGVYDRVRYLQGSLIPHCYGFHEITAPDGWKSYGLLLEVIDGPSLGKFGARDLPAHSSSTFITRLRHCLRALKFAGISQTDWHPDNILCPPVSGEALPAIVFIDFAFACQSLENTTLPSDEVELFAEMLKKDPVGLPGELVDSLWLPALEPEY